MKSRALGHKYLSMNLRTTLLWRIGIAWTVGLTVALAALNVLPSASYYIQNPQYQTQKDIQSLHEGVVAYRHQKGTLPSSLSQLKSLPEEMRPSAIASPIASDGTVLDIWGHPYAYSVHNGQPRITSLGADGAPGGAGLDFDLSNSQQTGRSNTRSLPREATPTMWQLATHPASQGILCSSLACGVLAFGMAWAGVREDKLNRDGIIAMVIPLLVTTVFAGFVAMIITGLHVPSGH